MTFSEDLVLVGYTYTKDEMLQETKIERRVSVQAAMRDVTRAEFHGTGYGEHKPNIVFDIHAFEYGGEQTVEHGGIKYTVLRSYTHTADGLLLVELTCEKRLIA